MTLTEIFNENTKNILMKGVETKEGFFYMEPNEEEQTVDFGTVCNAGLIVSDSFAYNFNESWEYNLEWMIGLMFEKYGCIETDGHLSHTELKMDIFHLSDMKLDDRIKDMIAEEVLRILWRYSNCNPQMVKVEKVEGV